MKTRKTLIKNLNELGNLGFLNYEEFNKITTRINNKYNGMGRQ